jgi:hypothetical protein
MQTTSSHRSCHFYKCRVFERSELSSCVVANNLEAFGTHMTRACQLWLQNNSAAPVCLSHMSSRPSSLPAATMPCPGPTNDTSFTVLMLRWPRYLPAAAAAAAAPRKEVVDIAWCAKSTGNSYQLATGAAAPSASYAHSIWSLDQCGHKKERMMNKQQCAGLTYT